jgi:hypothetical protein
MRNGGADLLGLLKSRANVQSASTPQLPSRNASTDGRDGPVSAADLVAGFSRKPSSMTHVSQSTIVEPAATRPTLRGEASSSSTNPQDFLLRLLNQGKPESSQPKIWEKSSSPPVASALSSSANLPTAHFAGEISGSQSAPTSEDRNAAAECDAGTIQDSSPRNVEPQQIATGFVPPQSKGFTFTAKNPFDEIPISPVLAKGPKSASPSKVDPGKHARDLSNNFSPPPSSKARKLSPSASPRVSQRRETVSQAVKGVSVAVDKQVEEAIASLSLEHHGESKSHHVKQDSTPAPSSPEQEPESWEDVADKGQKSTVKAFKLPMKAFVAIDIKNLDPFQLPVADITYIARLRKDFEQIDRNLVASTTNFIIYSLKHGGLRLIRQDSGKYRQLYAETNEPIFNISVCTTRRGPGTPGSETVICTGVRGSLIWVPLAKFGSVEGDAVSALNNEDHGFIFPPVVGVDESVSHSHGQLKTRAKASSRSPEFFGYGRGKHIHIVWPLVARSGRFTNPKTKICNSANYLEFDEVKINVGRAAKDFTFSADDTVIASLDKSGKLKLWDIRSLVRSHPNESLDARGSFQVTLEEPLMSFNTTGPSEKSWPTSVMFIDKEKPMNKGLASRYLVVGRKQNHTVQLWDIHLGKPVQEVNFPHDTEGDGICSLVYNAKSGILALGHPTRNSIYLLHVSPPKYTMAPMTQAKYLDLIATKNKALAPPVSTIIVPSIREYTLGDIGILRSLDIMHEPPTSSSDEDAETRPLFTVVVMHSRGIFEFGFKRADLGWTEGKTTDSPVDALETGAVTCRPIPSVIQADQIAPTAVTANDPHPSPVSLQNSSSPAKPQLESTSKTLKPEAKSSPLAVPKDKKKKKSDENSTSAPPTSLTPTPISAKAITSSTGSPAPAISPAPATTTTTTTPVPAASSQRDVDSSALHPSVNTSDKVQPNVMTADSMARNEAHIAGVLSQLLTDQSKALFQNITDDRQSRDAAFEDKQKALLKAVSAILNENTERTLTHIVVKNLTKAMEPLRDSLTTTVEHTVAANLLNLPREVESRLPSVVSKLFQDPDLVRSLAVDITQKVNGSVEATINKAVLSAVAPLQQTIQESMNRVEERMMGNVHEVLGKKGQATEDQFRELSTKVDHLTNVVRALLEHHVTVASRSNPHGTVGEHTLTSTNGASPQSAVTVQAASTLSAYPYAPDSIQAPPTGNAQLDEQSEVRLLLQAGKTEDAILKV